MVASEGHTILCTCTYKFHDVELHNFPIDKSSLCTFTCSTEAPTNFVLVASKCLHVECRYGE